MKRKALSIILILIVILAMYPTQAFAWKTKTHNYSANLLLEELEANDYKVCVPVDGDEQWFQIPDEYREALQKYPEMYRAGSLGPDVYPDMLTGQGWIHPYDDAAKVGSGDWLKLMRKTINGLNRDSEDRQKAIAFTLGYMAHYCGDMWGHDFVNAFAGGSYPAIATLTQEGPRGNALRHMSTEAYMDSLISSEYTSGRAVEIDAPAEFIMNSIYYNGNPANGASEILLKFKSLPPQLEYLVDFRARLCKERNDWADNKEVVISPLVTKYLDRWIQDLDRATLEMVKAFNRIGQRWARGDGGDVEVVKQEMEAWLNDYGVYASPFPDAVFKVSDWSDSIMESAINGIGLGDFKAKYDDFKNGLVMDAVSFVTRDSMGLTVDEIKALTSDAEGNLNGDEEGLYDKLVASLGTFGTDQGALNQRQEAFYNTLTMMKLVLMGPDNYSNFVYEYTGETQDNYHSNSVITMTDRLKVAIRTGTESVALEKYPGTNDNVYCKVSLTEDDGSIREIVSMLLDKPTYDDFEKGHEDEYDVPLGGSYPLGKLTLVIDKPNGTDDWYVDYVTVAPMNGDIYIHNNVNYEYFRQYMWIWQGSTREMTLHDYEGYVTQFDTGIVDYMTSLDMHQQWESGFDLYSNTQTRNDLFYNIFKGFDPIMGDPVYSYDEEAKTLSVEMKLEPRKNGLTQDLRKRLNDILPAVTGVVNITSENGQTEWNGTADVDGSSISFSIPDVNKGDTWSMSLDYSGSDYYAKANMTSEYTVPNDESEPDPIPAPDPEPIPAPDPEPDPAPIPDPDPTPAPDPAPIPEPAPIPDPEPAPVPDPAPIPDPEPAPVPVPDPAPIPDPEPMPVPDPVPIPDPEPAPVPNPEPVHQHVAGEMIKENEVAPTFESEGSYDEVIYCTVCGIELSRVHNTINKLSANPRGEEEKITAPKTNDSQEAMFWIILMMMSMIAFVEMRMYLKNKKR